MSKRIETLLRLEMPGAINVEGYKSDSPTGYLATGQTEAHMILDKYAGNKNRVILDKRFSAEGTKGNILELAAAAVKELQTIELKRSETADLRIHKLNEMMQPVDSDGEAPDKGDVRWMTDHLLAMKPTDRLGAIHKGFNADHKMTIAAVLEWPPNFAPLGDAKWLEELKRVHATARNPLVADEFATLTADRGRLKFTIQYAINQISEDSGLGKNTLRDRINDANDVIKESELRRRESTEAQHSGKNVRSVHENTPVTV